MNAEAVSVVQCGALTVWVNGLRVGKTKMIRYPGCLVYHHVPLVDQNFACSMYASSRIKLRTAAKKHQLPAFQGSVFSYLIMSKNCITGTAEGPAFLLASGRLQASSTDRVQSALAPQYF
eukprot:gene12318-2963_t